MINITAFLSLPFFCMFNAIFAKITREKNSNVHKDMIVQNSLSRMDVAFDLHLTSFHIKRIITIIE